MLVALLNIVSKETLFFFFASPPSFACELLQLLRRRDSVKGPVKLC